MSFAHKLKLYLKSFRMMLVQSKEEKSKFQDITADEALNRYRTAKNDYVWLDVRTQTEYDHGHIPGSKLIPIEQLENRIQEVGSKDKKYIVFCHAGGRSVAACMILNQYGYKNLTNMPGMSHWTGPTE